MKNDQLEMIVEALIFASDSPITLKQIKKITPEGETEGNITAAIERLDHRLEGHAFFIKRVSRGYQLATRPEYAQWVRQLFEDKARSRLSRAALETLSIIAFKQPISKVEVSAIRGVNSDGVIKGLLERRFITIIGRDSGAGRALLFVTTDDFLRYFGLNDIKDLPRPKEIEELLAEGEGGKLLSELPEEMLFKEDSTTDGAGRQPAPDTEQPDTDMEKNVADQDQ